MNVYKDGFFENVTLSKDDRYYVCHFYKCINAGASLIGCNWRDGIWQDGIFDCGIWQSGTWIDGKWVNGEWVQGYILKDNQKIKSNKPHIQKQEMEIEKNNAETNNK